MKYRILLFETNDGWAVSCPDLKGCHSQGLTRDAAVQNIREAIQLWLEAEAEESGIKRVETAEVVL